MTDALKQPEELRILADAIDPKEIMASGIAIPFNERQKREHSAAAALREYAESLERKPAAYMIEYYGSDCGPQYEIYKAERHAGRVLGMGWRDKSQYTPLYSAPQPAAPQVVPDGMVLVPIEPPIHAVARLPGTETEARRTYSRVIASASGGLVAYSCRDECEGGKHAACGDWCGNQEACLAVFKAVIPDAALPPAQAVPLTDGQIVDEAFRQEWGAGAFCAGVRFAERAHGIKQPGSDT